jgi:hypothetical protein
VKMVASSRHQKTSTRKATHGTPGWKYRVAARPETEKGMRATWRRVSSRSFTASCVNAKTQPTSTRAARTTPAQYSHTMRAASHHVKSSAERNR